MEFIPMMWIVQLNLDPMYIYAYEIMFNIEDIFTEYGW